MVGWVVGLVGMVGLVFPVGLVGLAGPVGLVGLVSNRYSIGRTDFFNPKVYGDTSIFDGLVILGI